MLLTRKELPILVVNAVYIPLFSIIALRNTDYEFVLYAGVVLAVAVWIVWKQSSVQFDRVILWGLTGWGIMHMAGGNLQVRGDVLYALQLIPVMLRYDQLVHTFGFGTVTLVCHHLLRPYLRTDVDRWWPLAILVVLMGSGVGALNEIIEFVAVKTVPETNVGGYVNTLWDLVFNLLGGLIAVSYLTLRRSCAAPSTP